MNRKVAKYAWSGQCGVARLRALPLFFLAASMLPAVSISGVTATGPTFGSGSGSFGLPLVISSPNGNGLKFFGNAFSECDASCLLQFDFSLTNSVSATIDLVYVFDISSFSGDVTWSITNGAATTYASGVSSGDSSSPVQFSGTTSVNPGVVRFSFSAASGDGFDVAIPNNSIDFTPGTPATVPEPGTWALGLAGLAWLAARRRK